MLRWSLKRLSMNIDRVDIDTHLAEDRPVAFFPGVVVVLALAMGREWRCG